ncbi:copper chaperone PCu(A)C [Deinococcus sp.]|uniref:copper chaperone PCu(A)C n=1 Tax=Deinococcus sp. TaxID=47478 RepID=UPI002869EA22|nr:copper chaperone PCu(A)C [Deinococcus sp.]
MSHLFTVRARIRSLLAALLLSVPALAQSGGSSNPMNSMDMTTPRPKPALASATPLNLKVTQARVVAVPPGITDTSLFVTLSNPGARPVVLSAARSPLAAHAMLMLTMRDAQGLTGMKVTPTLTVPAHGTLVLDDLGPHVMMMGLKRPLKPGETMTVILSDVAGHTLTIRAPVRKP